MEQTFQLVTANRLRDGAVVYFGPNQSWVEKIDEASRLTDKAQAERMLALAGGFVEARIIVNPYLIEIADLGPGLKPARMREVIRAAGPTVRRDLGKQAEH